MSKKGVEGKIEIKIEKVGLYFIVNIEDVLSRESFYKADEIKRRNCNGQ